MSATAMTSKRGFGRFYWLFLLLLSVAAITPRATAQIPVLGDGQPGPVKAAHLTAELVSLSPAIAPGGTLQAGLVLTTEDKWHVYWKNPGFAGQPPHLQWTLPTGITTGELQFAAPGRLPFHEAMDYGYEGVAAYPILLTAGKSVKTGKVHLEAIANWLVCSESTCVPGKAKLGLDLDVTPTAPSNPPLIGALGQAIQHIPKPLPAGAKATALLGSKQIVLTIQGLPTTRNLEFYPAEGSQINDAAPQTEDPLPGSTRLRLFRSELLTTAPATLDGVLRTGEDEAYQISAPVTAGEIPLPPQAAKAGEAGSITALGAIGLAFVGGIILNLMPCVFPVLFLKGLSLVQSSQEDRGRLRAHAGVYTLGILVSFWAMVGTLLVLRAGGSQAGWGYQLQSPTFLAILICALFFFSLSLAGMFDIGLSLTSAGGELAQQPGYAGSFFTGVLATVVATPCMAPFLGAAIGFALVQSAPIAIAIFTALGLGLALPYLLLSLQPAWTKLLPRPGAWMEVFKQCTALILFATVIWLVSVYGLLFPGALAISQLTSLLAAFLVLGVAGWVLGRWPARWPSSIVATVLALAAIALPLSSASAKPKVETWAPYTADALATARKAGKPVFIDFTAAWCLSCKVNERLVLQSSEVIDKLNSAQVVLLKADWTQYDGEITKELASIGRSGVPTYVVYPSAAGAQPDVLPEVLTKSVVLDALAKDLKK